MLLDMWNKLNENQRIYAYYLVSRYGWLIRHAIAQVYLHGYEPMPYDYRHHCVVAEPRSREFFNL